MNWKYWRDWAYIVILQIGFGYLVASIIIYYHHKPPKTNTETINSTLSSDYSESIVTTKNLFNLNDIKDPNLVGITYQVKSGNLVITIEDDKDPCNAYQEMMVTKVELVDPKPVVTILQEDYSYLKGNVKSGKRACEAKIIGDTQIKEHGNTTKEK